MNRRLWPPVETVFLTPKEEVLYLSSRLVREVVALGGDVRGLVPDTVRERLEAWFRETNSPPG
jgi:pantetheine-phosphate adenylyltransferase